MDKTIENKFFEAFRKGGVVDNCIEWTRLTHNLPVLKPHETRKHDETNIEDRCQELERKIWEWKEDRDYDFTGGLLRESSPLMDEIESNLKECITDDEKEQYVFSLLKHFGRAGCNCSVVFAPAGEMNRLDFEVTNWENYKKTCPKQDIQVCERMINHCKEQKKWIAQSLVDFETIGLSAFATESNTLGYWLGFFQDLVRVFGTRLDALLLENGMDLMRIQKDSGLYVQMMRDVSFLAEYLGSETLARRYIDVISQGKENVKGEPARPKTDIEEKQFNPKSNEIDKYIQPLWEFLNCDVIDNTEYTAFREAIYAADLNSMYKRAEEKKTVGRFRIAMGYVKTWFDDEWEDHAVANIGISKDLFRKYNIKENKKWCKKLEEVFKKYQPLHPHPASPRKIFD